MLRKAIEPFLFLLSMVFYVLVRVRNSLYDLGILKKYKASCPVISVGNLTTGGTGKTPIVIDLIDLAISCGLRPSVISRGYGCVDRHPRKVDLGESDPVEAFGDEPAMIAQKFPQISVFVGVHKVSVCHLATNLDSPDFILADDAFQHRRLRRDKDVVLIDASRSPKDLSLLPLGRAREPFSSIRRAHCLIFSKTNFSEPAWLNSMKQRAKQVVSKNCQIFSCETVIVDITNLSGEKLESRGSRAPVILCSGIGNPSFFEKLVDADSRFEVVDHLVFPDHHEFTSENVRELISTLDRTKAEFILITEKDAVKLARWSEKLEKALLVSIGLKWYDFDGVELPRKRLSEIFTTTCS